MKAARFYDRNDIRIEDIEQQELQPGTARVDVAWCGICGTDLHEYLDGPIFCPSHGNPHPISGEEPPVTMGHEFCGVISEVADDIDDLAVGDHVVVEPYIISEDVNTGPESKTYHLSENMNFIGLGGRGGGLAENVVVKRRWIHKISDKVSLDHAALIEPLTVGYHAVERAGVGEDSAGQVALIGGAGPIGLLTAAVLKAFGVTVVVSELSKARREKALETGVADHALNPEEVDVVAKIKELTDGAGADVAFECTSVPVVFDTLMDALRPRGVLQIVSIWGKPAEVDLNKIVLKELDVRGTIGYVNNHPAAIKLVEDGRVDLTPFVTARIGLDELIDEGFDTLIHRNETAVKILVSPSGKGLEK